MATEYGRLTVNAVKWILNKLSIQANDTQLLLVSFLVLSIILFILIIMKNFINKKYSQY